MSKTTEKKQFYSIPMRLLPFVIFFQFDRPCLPELKLVIKGNKIILKFQLAGGGW